VRCPSCAQPANLSDTPHREARRLYDQHGGAIIDWEDRKYPEMPEREEQEYLRMLAEGPWAHGTETDSRLNREHRR
jgi:hypothetical protein